MKNHISMILCLALCMVAAPGSAQVIAFSDLTPASGLGNTKNYNNQGLAIADFNGDGLDDIYVSVLLLGKNRFLVNQGNFIFVEVADFVGIGYSGTSRCSAWGDVDNDGDPDLYVGNRDENDLLYINQGDSTFQNKTLESGISNLGNTTSATMAAARPVAAWCPSCPRGHRGCRHARGTCRCRGRGSCTPRCGPCRP